MRQFSKSNQMFDNVWLQLEQHDKDLDVAGWGKLETEGKQAQVLNTPKKLLHSVNWVWVLNGLFLIAVSNP